MYRLVEEDRALVGFIAFQTIAISFICLLIWIVNAEGIAQVWSRARDRALHSETRAGSTVNSSPTAVAVYEKRFRPVGPVVKTDGIAFLPMSLKLNHVRPTLCSSKGLYRYRFGEISRLWAGIRRNATVGPDRVRA